MIRYAVVEAPSVLGLFPGGVEDLPAALLGAGLLEAISARHAGRVTSPLHEASRDPESGVRNVRQLRAYSIQLAEAVGLVLDEGDVPVVLGGDCSILLGPALELRRRGRYGLFFLDGHADFYQPSAEPAGEAASMDLALVTGRGPLALTDIDGLRPLFRDGDVVQFGRRDAEEAANAGSQRIEDTNILTLPLQEVRDMGVAEASAAALRRLTRSDLDGFWVHLDCDVLSDEIMPAVDYRLPGGLTWEELETVLGLATDAGRSVGFEVTIFNPRLDPDGSQARRLVSALARGLQR